MSTTPENVTLDELTVLEAAATPGPWFHEDDLSHRAGQSLGMGPLMSAHTGASATAKHDAITAAAARNALPDLLKIARAVAQVGDGDIDGPCPFCRVPFEEVCAPDCAHLLAQKLAGGAT
jgi:hypothetical protein